jgi:hypothetical protein
MFSFLTNALLLALLTGNLGGVSWCPQSSDPTRRINQLYNVSENSALCEDAWERYWQIDQPSRLTPVRVHGGIGP